MKEYVSFQIKTETARRILEEYKINCGIIESRGLNIRGNALKRLFYDLDRELKKPEYAKNEPR